eukprot:3303388-Rhodomonas_salina.1
MVFEFAPPHRWYPSTRGGTGTVPTPRYGTRLPGYPTREGIPPRPKEGNWLRECVSAFKFYYYYY